MHLSACQNEFDSPWTDIECSIFKPPPYLHARMFCKQNNQLPTNTHVELKDNSIVSIVLLL